MTKSVQLNILLFMALGLFKSSILSKYGVIGAFAGVAIFASACSVRVNFPNNAYAQNPNAQTYSISTESTSQTTASPSPSPSPSEISGLLAWWKLDDGSGATAADSSGNGNAGTVVGSPSWITGIGGAGALDLGAGQYVDVGSKIFATQNSPFSFTAWFNPTDYNNAAPVLMQIESDTDYPFFVLLSSLAGYYGISFGSADTWACMDTGGTLPTAGSWHHVAVTYNGAGPGNSENFVMYVDGMQVPLSGANTYGSEAQENLIGVATPQGTSGVWSGSGIQAANQWDGGIQDVRIYDHVLSAGDVQYIMMNPE